jgi:hypothetical protein
MEAATLLNKPCPASLPVASDPTVDGIAVDAEHPRGLGLGHVVQHRSDDPGALRRLRRRRY